MILKLKDRISRGLGDKLVDEDNVLDPMTNSQYLKMLEDEKRTFSVDVSVYADLDSCGEGFVEMVYEQVFEKEEEGESGENGNDDLSETKMKIHSIFEALGLGPGKSSQNLYASPDYILNLKRSTNCRIILMTSDYFMAQKYSEMLDQLEDFEKPSEKNSRKPSQNLEFQSHLKHTIQIFNNRDALVKFAIKSARFSQGIVLSNDAIFASISNIFWAPMIFQKQSQTKFDDKYASSTLLVFDGNQLFNDDQEKLLYFPVLWEYFDFNQIFDQAGKAGRVEKMEISENMNFRKIVKGSNFLQHAKTSGIEKILQSCLKNFERLSGVFDSKDKFLNYFEEFTNKILELEKLPKFESFIEERSCQGLSLDKFLLYDEDFVAKLLKI